MIQAMLRVHGGIKRIPNNMENYISFSLGNLRFIDSVNFLLSSLDYLAKGSDPNSFKMLQRRGTYRSSLAVCRNFIFNFMSSTSLFNHCKPSSICCSLLSIPLCHFQPRYVAFHNGYLSTQTTQCSFDAV